MNDFIIDNIVGIDYLDNQIKLKCVTSECDRVNVYIPRTSKTPSQTIKYTYEKPSARWSKPKGRKVYICSKCEGEFFITSKMKSVLGNIRMQSNMHSDKYALLIISATMAITLSLRTILFTP